MTETQKAIEAEEIKNDILERFKPYLKYGVLDFTENLSAQMSKYAQAYAAKSLEEKEKRVRELEEALRECEEYFDSRADADHDENGFVPNEELNLLSMIQQLIY